VAPSLEAGARHGSFGDPVVWVFIVTDAVPDVFFWPFGRPMNRLGQV
jgi:hypothetical protein